MACFDTAFGGFCSPVCGNDADCNGKKCDLSSGLCVTSLPRIDAPLGSKCTPDARGVAPECSFCLSLVDNVDAGASSAVASFCSGVCRLLTLGACSFGTAVADAASPTGACVLPAETSTNEGDLGYCAQLCDVDADCLNPTFGCDTSAASALGRGVCTVPGNGVDAGASSPRDASAGGG
jgi:hypothetical protein